MSDVPDRGILTTALAAALLAASALAAAGRFRAALALTLGAVVAIVSARWLSHVVGRLPASGPREGLRPGWKFALGAGLRYLIVGFAVFGAVSLFTAEAIWLLAGLSTVVLGVVIDGLRDLWRERSHGRIAPPGPKDGAGRARERI